MKKSIVLTFLFIISFHHLFSQVTKDSIAAGISYSPFHDGFSAEESWKIHKEAYLKQLKSKNLSAKEIELKSATYDQQEQEFIEKINQQRKLADVQRQEAEELRKQADIQRREAEEQRKVAEVLRIQAEEIRRQANIRREEAEKQREQAEILRQQAEEQTKQDAAQFKKAEESIKKADTQFKKADVLFKEVDAKFKEADKQFKKVDQQIKRVDSLFRKADEQIRKAEGIQTPLKPLLTKKIVLTSDLVKINPIVVKVDQNSSLVFNIECTINSGASSVEIFNPSGGKEGELLLEHGVKKGQTKENEFSKSTSGYLNKTISNAATGNWQIKINSRKATGNATVSVAKTMNSDLNE